MMKNICRPIAAAIIFWCLLFQVTPAVFAQRPGGGLKDYPFVKIRHNRILNDRPGLDNFYGKLRALKTDRTGSVTIVHIGDSHIQADFMTAAVRERLQGIFGNAGRGLVFPYQLAKTNGPVDYRSYSNTVWRFERNASRMVTLPMGISGFTLETNQEGAAIRLSLTGAANRRYTFDRITVFHDNNRDAFPFAVTGNNTGGIDENAVRQENHPSGTTFFLSSHYDSVTVAALRTGDDQRYARFYGISLENGTAGVLYHMAGVNGATFKNFNESVYFASQLRDLRPDLVIVSLGTNDATDRGFSSQEIYSRIGLLAGSIKTACPDTDILFTILPDFGSPRNRRLKQNIFSARSAVIIYSREKGHAFWDLYNVMGGQGSFQKWKKFSLAQGDMVHFTKSGYALQGSLLADALMEGFTVYGSR